MARPAVPPGTRRVAHSQPQPETGRHSRLRAGIGDLQSEAEAFIVRTFDLGKGQAARDRDIALHSPVLAILGTAGDSRLEWLQAGQALSAVLLRARVEDVWASFLNQPIEVPEIRPRLQAVGSQDCLPQIVLRLGFGPEAKATPRRSVRDVLLPPRHRPIHLRPQG